MARFYACGAAPGVYSCGDAGTRQPAGYGPAPTVKEVSELNPTENLSVTEIASRRPQPEAYLGHVNTTRNTYDIMESEDEDDIAFIVPAGAYRAQFKDGSTRPLAVWCVTEGGRMYGVTLTSNGKLPLSLDNVEDEPGFSKYGHREE